MQLPCVISHLSLCGNFSLIGVRNISMRLTSATHSPASRRIVVLSSSKEPGSISNDNSTNIASSEKHVISKTLFESMNSTTENAALFSRRILLGLSVGILVALVGNVAGVASFLLNMNVSVSRKLRADLLFPINGFKRCFETSEGYEFIYPSTWVGDQRLLYRAIEKAEKERENFGNLPPLNNGRSSKRMFLEPQVAFGPPGTDGEMNVSVISAPIPSGLTLLKLGGANEVGNFILKNIIAPDGSSKVATLLHNSVRESPELPEAVYYTLEYTVKAPTFERHNISIYVVSKGHLYTLNVQASEKVWNDVEHDLREIVSSFRLL